MSEEMMITSYGNPLVKQVRALRHRKERVRSGLFLVEGIHHVGEMVAAGWQIEKLVYAPELLSSDFARQVLKDQQGKIEIRAVVGDVFESMTEKENPQGILAVVRKRVSPLGLSALNQGELAVALLSPQDPGNLGTILRTMDAVGVNTLLLLDGGVDLYHPSCVRASMGALFWKTIYTVGFSEFLAWVKAAGYFLMGTSAHGSMDYRSCVLTRQAAILLLGSEQKGLTEEQSAACDVLVSLPMRGRASSLNLSVAASVLLYHFSSRHK